MFLSYRNGIVCATLPYPDIDSPAPESNAASDRLVNGHLPVMGREVVVAVTCGKLDFVPREKIFYDEFDGGRRKRVLDILIGKIRDERMITLSLTITSHLSTEATRTPRIIRSSWSILDR